MINWITKDKAWELPTSPLLGATTRGAACVLELAKGSIELTAVEPSIMRLRYSRSGAFSVRPSRAVVTLPTGSTTLVEGKSGPGILAGRFCVDFDRSSSGITVSGSNGIIFSSEGPFLLDRDSVSLTAILAPDESIYGLGEKTGFLDRRGRYVEMWNTDDPVHTPDKDPLYQSIPFLIRFDGVRASGLFLDSTARSFFDLGFSDPERLGISVHDTEMDLYFIEGPSIADVVSAYTRLTGNMNLPPRWALGFGQSRWSYHPESRVMDLAISFRKRDIPCDTIYLDIDYMDGYRVFTWNGARFPDPARMCSKLARMGFRVVTIVDPGVKRDALYPLYVGGAREGRFCRLADGSIYHGKVWPGESAYPDFSSRSTREWWAHAHRPLLESGVSGIWNDMNEPSDFSSETGGDRRKATVPDEVMSDEDGEPRSFALSHNAYGLDMCRATAQAFEEFRPGKRPFVLTRAGYAGIQRYAAVWTGDNHSWWEHLAQAVPMQLGLGLSGICFVGGDSGGFQGDADGELFARWMEFSALTPFFRAHSFIDSKPHEPWSFGPETEAAARDAIRLRYSLLPYLYSEFRKASLDGLPVMRPLVLDYQNDTRTRNLCDEFLLGRSLLVAPVLRPAERERLVYLPEGLWYDFHTKEAIEGGRSIIAAAPFNRIPLFVRAGALIPLAEPADSTALMDFSRLRIEAYAGARGAFELYEDDGESFAYREGAYTLTRYEIAQASDGEWKIHSERICNGWTGACASPMVKLIGGPWKGPGDL